MKYVKKLSLAALGIGVLIAAISCDLIPEEPITKQDRIAFFRDDLNKDAGRTKISRNLHPEKRAPYRDPAAWDGTLYYGNKPFAFGELTYTNDAEDVSGTAEGQFSWAFDEQTCYIHLKKYGQDWFIYSMKLGSDDTELFP